jgi:hypothetical protein
VGIGRTPDPKPTKIAPCRFTLSAASKKATTASSASAATTEIPYFNTPTARDTFVSSLESTRKKYSFDVIAYVVMPEHVHLLVGEPAEKPLATAIHRSSSPSPNASPQAPSGSLATTIST